MDVQCLKLVPIFLSDDSRNTHDSPVYLGYNTPFILGDITQSFTALLCSLLGKSVLIVIFYIIDCNSDSLIRVCSKPCFIHDFVDALRVIGSGGGDFYNGLSFLAWHGFHGQEYTSG